MDMKGTTAAAFHIKDLSGNQSVKVVVDSRASSEKNGIVTIKRTQKYSVVTQNIVTLMVGSQNSCYAMRANLRQWVNKIKEFNEDITVSKVVNHLNEYLQELLNENPDQSYEFGNIVAGYDNIEGLQIYQIVIINRKIKKVKAKAFTSMGSGAFYAMNCFASPYTLQCSDEDSEEFAFKTLFNASYYDKRTDGNINCIPITIHGVQDIKSIDSLEAYLIYYADYDEKCVLFLVYNATKETKKAKPSTPEKPPENPILSVDLLAGYFRKYGRIIAAHCVSKRMRGNVPGKGTFYFHRIIFCSEREADKACKEIHEGAQPNQHKFIPFEPFRHVSKMFDLKVYVMKASISILEHIVESTIEVERQETT